MDGNGNKRLIQVNGVVLIPVFNKTNAKELLGILEISNIFHDNFGGD